MTITNADSGTNVVEIAPRIYRISTPVPPERIPGGFTFNQFLLDDEQPLLFHTGLRGLFPLVEQAVAHVLGDVKKLRWVSFSHVEADESGSLNHWLAAAPQATPLCGTVAAMVSVDDLADRAPHALPDGGEIVLGEKRVRWLDAPHVPHNWECGYLFEVTTRTLLCGDLLTHLGSAPPALTESDSILEQALAATRAFGDSVPGPHAQKILDKLARTEPRTLALMHGSSFQGDGAALLRGLAAAQSA